jgi:signal transduction histidine kinase
MNTQTKTTLLFLSSFLAIILIFSGFIYAQISSYSYVDFFNLLKIRAITTAKAELDILSDEMAEFRMEYLDQLPNEQDYIFKIRDTSDFTIVSSEVQALGLPYSFFQNIIETGQADYNNKGIFFKGIYYRNDRGNFIVISSAENYMDVQHAAYLKKSLIVSITVAFLLSVLISLFFSKRTFKPIAKITEKVKEISSENLHLRLDLKDQKNELGELIRTFNNMLDRIETSFETQNNFISNASHELRTPLTAIIGEADVSLSKIRKPEDYIETIRVMLDEAEKLDAKTKALFFLAQTGFNGKAQKFEKVRIDQLLYDVKETIKKINSASKVHLDMSLLPENPMMLKVKANEQLLHLALTNIISNACKYSNDNVVKVSLGASDNKVIVVVKDSGIGIPENELKYIYDPFFRASNTSNYEGFGIGLPLTNNIIRMHKGEIKVSSIVNKGTTVQIILPVGDFSAV